MFAGPGEATAPPPGPAAPPPPGPAAVDRPRHPRPRGTRVPGRLAFWRSPADQPRAARPALLAVAALAGLAYGWAWAGDALETFYGGATRSMTESARNFFFGSFDPWGTISIDKLPGSLWVDALSARMFGFHVWALVLPHVAEGVLTVLVLYRAVRRLAGAAAGLAAAAVLAASPVTVLLDRGNIPDSLMTLLLVLAADATGRALTGGGRRSLLLAGVWVGLAFQVKMLEAWMILPCCFLAYLVAAPEGRLGRRARDCLVTTAVVLAVSLSWMLVVTAVPASHRPYVDGSSDDSVFTQVFVYNGLDRLSALAPLDRALGPPQPFLALFARQSPLAEANVGQKAGPGRLLAGRFGDDAAWLLPAAGLSAVGILVGRRRRSRTDTRRAACLLWGSWLLVDLAFLSAGSYLNSYYMASFVPAVAALCGMGLSGAMAAGRTGRRPRQAMAAVVSLTALYAVYLLPSSAGVGWWLVPVVLVGAAAADLLLLSAPSGRRGAVRARLGFVAGAAAGLAVPAVASVLVVLAGLGPFDAPFQPARLDQVSQSYRTEQHDIGVALGQDPRFRVHGAVAVFGVDSSDQAALDVMLSGREVLPIGGFSGAAPAPTLADLRRWIGEGRIGTFILPRVPRPTDPRVRWLERHCTFRYDDGLFPVLFGLYSCAPRAATIPAPARP